MFRACELTDQTYKKTRTLHFCENSTESPELSGKSGEERNSRNRVSALLRLVEVREEKTA